MKIKMNDYFKVIEDKNVFWKFTNNERQTFDQKHTSSLCSLSFIRIIFLLSKFIISPLLETYLISIAERVLRTCCPKDPVRVSITYSFDINKFSKDR